MLYLFYGTDRNTALEKALSVIEKKVKERPDAVVFKVDQTNLSKSLLAELCSGQGMFEQKYIVHLKDVLQDELSKEIVFDFLKDIESSGNIFIMTEGNLLKADFSKIEKRAEKVWNHDKKKMTEREENIFALSDYLISRDRKNLWITYQKFLKSFAPEEIHGTMFWGFKNMVLAAKTKSASEAGLNSFVYSKSKKASQKYSVEELDTKFWELTKLLGDSRKGGEELELMLERWVLGL